MRLTLATNLKAAFLELKKKKKKNKKLKNLEVFLEDNQLFVFFQKCLI